MELLQEISESLQRGDSVKVSDLTKKAIDEKLEPKEILDNGLIAGMAVIGEKFKAHEIFLPDVLLAAKAMYTGLDLLKPLFIDEEMPSIGKVVIGTVQGDLHDIGKNLDLSFETSSDIIRISIAVRLENRAGWPARRRHIRSVTDSFSHGYDGSSVYLFGLVIKLILRKLERRASECVRLNDVRPGFEIEPGNFLQNLGMI
jgi:hypothetical protein